MRVAFALTQSLDSPSGLGRYGPIGREMVRLGYAVETYALHYDWSAMRQRVFDDAGVQVCYAGQMHVRKVGSQKLYYGPARLLSVVLSSTLRLALALARSSADVIHLGKPQPINALAARLGRRGRPIYCDCDDYEAATNRFSGQWQRTIVRSFEDGVAAYAAGLTTNTHFTEQRYEHLGYPRRRIVYVPNGVDRARFSLDANNARLPEALNRLDRSSLILYVGTMSTLSHSVDLLLRAFVQVRREQPLARLLLVGGGEDYEALQQLAAGLGLGDSAIFAGRVDPASVPACFGLAAVSVDPVRDDPVAQARSPLKVVESLAAGTPVVTSPVGDRAAVLDDGAMGVLVAPGSEEALAHGLLELLSHPKRREEMAARAAACREKWFWDHLVRDFVQVYGVR